MNRYGIPVVRAIAISVAAMTIVSSATSAAADFDAEPFLPNIVTSSTIPANGDLNPYGVAIVPSGFPAGGTIAPGDVLVSNFNNLNNLQGTGTTIIKLTPSGTIAPAVSPGQPGNATTFFQGSGLGLTTALGVLQTRVCPGRQCPDLQRGDPTTRIAAVPRS